MHYQESRIRSLRLGKPYSNSEQDIKYPQRGQTILQWFDSRRLPHAGQNWLGNSCAASRSSYFWSASATTASESRVHRWLKLAGPLTMHQLWRKRPSKRKIVSGTLFKKLQLNKQPETKPHWPGHGNSGH